MSNKTQQTTQAEYLSALLDDEAGTFEKKRLLDDVQNDEKLQQKVAHYSLIGEVMRNEQNSVTIGSNFLSGIHDRLQSEPTYNKVQVKAAANQPSWLKPMIGGALAASLAAVIVVGMTFERTGETGLQNIQNMQMALQSTPEPLADSGASKTTTEAKAHAEQTLPLSVATADQSFELPDAVWRKRLKSYVNSHVKYASTSAIMPSVRAVSYASNF